MNISASWMPGPAMHELDFHILSAAIAGRSVVPTLLFSLRIANRTLIPVEAISLQCQIRIDPARRRYDQTESGLLRDLFGPRDGWNDTLRGFLWTHVSANIPAFESQGTVDLPVPCSYDFNIAATKFFHGIAEGAVPLTFLFSGSVFYHGTDGDLQIAPVRWATDAQFRLPVALWREMMERYYPEGVWLPVDRATLDRLQAFREKRGLSDCSGALAALVQETAEECS